MRPTQLGQSMISDDPFAKPLVDAAYKTKIHLQTTITPLPSPEKGPRGRQQAKPAKDKPIRR
jgi:hypothetical protein